MSQPPPLSADDRARAGAAGVAARQARARLRAGLTDGTLDLADALAAAEGDSPEARAIARMKVADLLAGLRGIGPVRAADLMAEVGIAANRRVGGLGVHQGSALIERVGSRPPRQR